MLPIFGGIFMDPVPIAQRIIAETAADSYGAFSPSVYETARVVTLAPDLAGHRERMRFLRAGQQADGSWGGPEGYDLLPSLSATEALLTELRRTSDPELGPAADQGLKALFARLHPDAHPTLPDTVAVEILVPGLIADINAHLSELDTRPLPALDPWRGVRLPHLPGTYVDLLYTLRDAVSAGHALPAKLLHSLEVIGPAAQGVHFARPGEHGTGCSPAATAVWFGHPRPEDAHHPGLRYLERVQARHDGPVPVAAPLDVFERAWILSTFLATEIPVSVPADVVDSLRAAFGESGVAGGAGLPPDADDTSSALYALTRLGLAPSAECLWTYQMDDHFSTFPEERTPSITTNAHVLQFFAATSDRDRRVADTMCRLSAWLCAQQHDDGSWSDKWHASPYYATLSCVVALADSPKNPEIAATVGKAVRWILDSQRANGSWGRWEGTYEETAYAVRTLLHADGGPPVAVESAAARGCVFLREAEGREHPQLWHDKDLYTPSRIVRAEGIAALHLAAANPRVAALLSEEDAGRNRRTVP
jgi:halimadienyl-diphosphate synthase